MATENNLSAKVRSQRSFILLENLLNVAFSTVLMDSDSSSTLADIAETTCEKGSAPRI